MLSLLNQLQEADQVDNLSGYSKTSHQYAAAETKWKLRQAANDNSWAAGRDKLFTNWVNFEGISSPCNNCGDIQLPIVRCQNCCKYFCCKCDELFHSVSIMHHRVTILNGLRCNLSPMDFLKYDGACFKKS